MISLFKNWYSRYFSDPSAVALFIVLIVTSGFVLLFSQLLMPVFVALAIAFLLDLPVNKMIALGFSRSASVAVVVSSTVGISLVGMLGLMPVMWQQSSKLVQEFPQMLSQGHDFLLTLPEKYPEVVAAEQIGSMITYANEKLIEWGQFVLQASLNSISDLVALMVYLILVPLMVFFFLKDKRDLIDSVTTFLPDDRRMASQVGKEMHQQMMNYLRGKLIEILIVGFASTITFIALDLQYAVLLGVLVGLSVLVPYVGATIVTFPVMFVGLFQWGLSPEFGYLMLAYGIIQAIDGNIIVPLLFSEAVNLHPVTIIIAVIFFGGIWGFWGIFFAIPLATLVKAVLNAWSTSKSERVEPLPEQ